MTRSIWPISRNIENNSTPRDEPTTPPASRMNPIRKSTLPRRQCASTPDTDEATIWFASVATATGAGTPKKISKGVIRKPPPTPNIPDKKPTPPPRPIIMAICSDTSAIGR